ncbi:MAG: hypothetical protein ACI9OD_001676, partial [Limisphaerales bacterium]
LVSIHAAFFVLCFFRFGPSDLILDLTPFAWSD